MTEDIAKTERSTPRTKHRPHDPERLGSRVYRGKGGWYHVDLRWRGSGRPVLRNPDAIGWSEKGDRTQDQRTAEKWAAAYDAHLREIEERARERTTGEYRTMRHAADDFLAERQVHRSSSTHSGDSTAVKYLLGRFGSETDPADITVRQMQAMFNDLLAMGYRANTVSNLRNHMAKLFDFSKVKSNPARTAKLPKPPEEDVVPWDETERQEIRDAASAIDREQNGAGPCRRCLVEFFFASGARIQEVAAACWEHIDASEKTIRIAKQISRGSNRPTHTKGRKPRSVTLMPEWWAFHKDGARGLIFPGPDGKPIPYRKLYGYVVEILERAGLKRPGQAAHQFRHTYAFSFLQRGSNLDRLQKCLGHKKISTTQKYYDHFTTEHAARAAAREIYGSALRGPRKD